MVTRHTLPSPQLERAVTFRIYHPERNAERPLPVLYMYDGDVVFREGSHGFDLPGYDAAHPGFLPEVLVVGIEPPQDRWQRTADASRAARAGTG